MWASGSPYGCNEANYEDVHEAIVIVARGECAFTSKVLHAEQAGAKAVIIANNADPFATPSGDLASTIGIHIPSLMISAEDTKAFTSRKGQDLSVELDWTVEKRDTVDWQLWSSTFDANTLQIRKGHVNAQMREFAIPANLLRQFELIDVSLRDKAAFTPRVSGLQVQ